MIQIKLTSGPFARDPKLVKNIIIHCSATPPGRDIGAAEIREWHKQRGFRDIGYHFVVRLDGTVETGRPLGEYGAHCLGKNESSIGICYVGGVAEDCKTPADTRTAAQKKALDDLVAQLIFTFPWAMVYGHRDFAAKACPSFDATDEYKKKLAIGTVLTGLMTATGCKSQKDVVAHAESNVEVKGDVTESLKVSELVNDSVEIRLEEPVMEILRPDSTKVTVRAATVTARRRRAAERTEQGEVKENVVETVRAETTEQMHRQNAPPGGCSIVWPLLALVILAAFLRKLNQKRDK